MADPPFDDDFIFDPQMGQELCDAFTKATGYPCIFVETGGVVVASSLRDRIGTIHVAGGRIMAGELAECAVTAEEAKASGGLMLEGLSVAIDLDGIRRVSFGIGGPLSIVTPIARIVALCVKSILQAREFERKLAAQLGLEDLNASKRLIDDMRLRATTDPLTGVWNRAQIEDAARNEMQRLTRYGHPVSMIFCDLDRFKAVNDSFGHAVGDRVLRSFCDVVRRCTRSLDALGRWGGEEFLIVAPNSGQDVARMLAGRIRKALRQHDFSPVKRVTASFGVAECLPYESFDSWLARADAALYQAKKSGRDRVVVAAPAGAEMFIAQQLGRGFIRLVWDSRFDSGNAMIDEQHKRLFNIANTLLDAVVEGRPREAIVKLVGGLVDEVTAHFADEEVVLDAIGFPEAEAHRELHRRIVDKAVKLSRQFEEGRVPVIDLFSFLAYDVIANHLMAEDRKFLPYLTKAAGPAD